MEWYDHNRAVMGFYCGVMSLVLLIIDAAIAIYIYRSVGKRLEETERMIVALRIAKGDLALRVTSLEEARNMNIDGLIARTRYGQN
jgi:hypothetical protein